MLNDLPARGNRHLKTNCAEVLMAIHMALTRAVAQGALEQNGAPGQSLLY